MAVDELEVGLTAIAAPIRNAHGDVIASLSVSGPKSRMPYPRTEEIGVVLMRGVAEISKALGA